MKLPVRLDGKVRPGVTGNRASLSRRWDVMTLDFSDRTDFQYARRGLIAARARAALPPVAGVPLIDHDLGVLA